MMIKKELELERLCAVGTCRAYISDDCVTIKAIGVSGCLKAWLTGNADALELGNLVNGSITKSVDTTDYSGVLITQSGRQMFYGKYRTEDVAEQTFEKPIVVEKPIVTEKPLKEESEKIFSFNDGFNWRMITDKSFPSDSLSARYILSHRSFYNAFLMHGRYFYGEKGSIIAIAIECDIKNEPHPMPHLSTYSILRDGYMIVCANINSRNFCVYEY